MRVHILGTRGEIDRTAPRYARHAGVLIDRRILLDLGEAAYLRHRPDAIFVSHLHPDHAAFLATPLETDADIYLPEPSRKLPGAKILTSPVEVGAYRIVPVPTEHSHRVRSMGFVVERGRRRIFYSSDLVSIRPRYRARLGRLDLVITEGSFLRRGGLVRTNPSSGRRFGHAGLPDLIDFFRGYTQRIVVMHFGSWFYHDIPAARRRIAALGDGVSVTAAHDGRVVVL